MNGSIRRRVTWLGLAVFVAVYLFSRMIWIDQDVRYYGLASISQIDEVYYALPAYDLYQYGSFRYTPIPAFPNDSHAVNLVANIFTFMSLLVFGQGYAGLRGGSVLTGLLICLMMFRLFRTLDEEDGIEDPAARVAAYVFLALFLVLEFAFLTETRINRPILSQIFGTVASILLYAFVIRDPTARRGLVAGALMPLCTLLVYPTNLFIIPAFGAALLSRSSTARSPLAGFVVGFTTSAVVIAAVTRLLFIGDRMPAMEVATLLTFPPTLDNVIKILAGNLFRVNPIATVLFLVCLPIYVRHARKQSGELHRFVLLLGLSYVCQSSMFGGYPDYKHAVFLPFFWVVVLRTATIYGPRYVRELWPGGRGNRRGALPFFFCLVFLACVAANYSIGSLGPGVAESVLAPGLALTMTVLAAVPLLIFLLAGWRSRAVVLPLLTLSMSLGLSSYYSYTAYYQRPTFALRDFGRAIAPIVGDSAMAGGMPHFLRLQTRVRPAANPYAYMYREGGLRAVREGVVEAVRNGDIQYIFGYEDLPEFYGDAISFESLRSVPYEHRSLHLYAAKPPQ